MNDAIIEQAADWVSRTQGGIMDDNDRNELKSWMDQSLEHARVFQRMSGILTRTEILHDPAGRTLAAKGVIPLPRRAPRWMAIGAALAAALAVVAVMFIGNLPDASYSTAIGERRSVPLEDGSTMHLNALTEVEVTYRDDERFVKLVSGEALFEVTPNTAQPFVVHTGELQVRVLGTTFSVTAYANEQRVAVVEGEVAVRQASSTNGPSSSLRRGQQLALHAGALGAPEPINISEVAAWREGWLYLQQRPLQELVDRLNRQYHGHIEIADAELAATNVNIVLRLESRDATLRRLQQLLPVVAEESAGERVTLRARD